MDAKRTLAEQVAETLKRRILSGHYRPGSKLPAEVALAEELRVNRFTVRAAMNQLEQLRLIRRRAGAGTVVLDYSEHAGVDVLEYLVLSEQGVVNTEVLASALEFASIVSGEVAALAAARRSTADLHALDGLLARLRSEPSLSRLFWLDFELNWALATAARNIMPKLLLNSVRELLEKYTHLLETLWVTPGSVSEGYTHVVEAVRAKDAERARALVRWIWTSRHARFIEAIGEAEGPRPKLKP